MQQSKFPTQIPQRYKVSGLPFHGMSCHPKNHQKYVTEPLELCRTLTRKYKALHGYHCSLADAHELCLYYIQTRLNTCIDF